MSRSSTATNLDSFTLDEELDIDVPATTSADDSSETTAASPVTDDTDDAELAKYEATQKALDATQLYLGEIGYSPLLTAEEEVLYARRALRGDEVARKRMIESNLRLVVKISRRYSNRGTGYHESNPYYSVANTCR